MFNMPKKLLDKATRGGEIRHVNVEAQMNARTTVWTPAAEPTIFIDAGKVPKLTIPLYFHDSARMLAMSRDYR
jgi:hypothetical protein